MAGAHVRVILAMIVETPRTTANTLFSARSQFKEHHVCFTEALFWLCFNFNGKCTPGFDFRVTSRVQEYPLPSPPPF